VAPDANGVASRGEGAAWRLVHAGDRTSFPVHGQAVVGRSRAADLRISEGYVSRRHARLWTENGVLWVEDLGSTNGTWVNGERVEGPRALGPGDRITFDRTDFHVEVRGGRQGGDTTVTSAVPRAAAAQGSRSPGTVGGRGPEAPPAPSAPAPSAPALPPQAARAGAGAVDLSVGDLEEPASLPERASAGSPAGGRRDFVLLGLSAPVEGRLFELAPGTLVIGREPACELRIDAERVAGRHAVLTVGGRGCRVEAAAPDLDLFVNGRPERMAELAPGDLLRVGRTEILFDDRATLGPLRRRGDAGAWGWALTGFLAAMAMLTGLALLLV
jgi:pSer/pThr/pTyr-binding forkhead associated (FHA) protein